MGEKKPDNDAVRKKHGDMPRCLLRCADECAWPIQGLASWAISEHRPEMTSQAYMVAKWASLKRISTNTSPPGIARCGGSHDGTPRPPRPPKFRFVCCFWKTPPNPENQIQNIGKMPEFQQKRDRPLPTIRLAINSCLLGPDLPLCLPPKHGSFGLLARRPSDRSPQWLGVSSGARARTLCAGSRVARSSVGIEGASHLDA